MRCMVQHDIEGRFRMAFGERVVEELGVAKRDGLFRLPLSCESKVGCFLPCDEIRPLARMPVSSARIREAGFHSEDHGGYY